jgi:hypothetical protein
MIYLLLAGLRTSPPPPRRRSTSFSSLSINYSLLKTYLAWGTGRNIEPRKDLRLKYYGINTYLLILRNLLSCVFLRHSFLMT